METFADQVAGLFGVRFGRDRLRPHDSGKPHFGGAFGIRPSKTGLGSRREAKVI